CMKGIVMAGKVRVTERTSMAVWLSLEERERLAAVAEYLGGHASGRSIAYGKNKANRYSLDELAQLRAAQPAFPLGAPAGIGQTLNSEPSSTRKMLNRPRGPNRNDNSGSTSWTISSFIRWRRRRLKSRSVSCLMR